MESSAMSIDSSNSGMEIGSTISESSFMSHQNVCAFGLPSDLSGLNLPSKRDILKYYFFLSEREKEKSKRNRAYEKLTPQVSKKVIEIWGKLKIEIIRERSIAQKLNIFINKYKNLIKNKSRADVFSAYLDTINDIFYIGKCRCNLKTTLCSCGLIPDHLKEFMFDQHTVRKNTIPECAPDIIDEQSTVERSSVDPTYVPNPSHTDEEFSFKEPAPLKRHYAKRYETFNFAMVCDRFGISDRVASCLATALFRDIGFRDDSGDFVVMDKSKVAREKAKCRDSVRRQQRDSSSVLAFSFDGRKSDSLVQEQITEKIYTRTVKESHLVVVQEPKTKLLGSLTVDAEDAATKQRKLQEFFVEKNLLLDDLIGICCDGENTNTGTENGILRRFEIALGRPLHWFVCLLHFNELPFRHLFNALEKSSTSGPRTASGRLAKLIETCEKIQVLLKLL